MAVQYFVVKLPENPTSIVVSGAGEIRIENGEIRSEKKLKALTVNGVEMIKPVTRERKPK